MSSATQEALGPLHDYVEYDHASDNFRDDVLHGLRQSPKRLPSKYFYDERGSQLFDDICELPGVLSNADGDGAFAHDLCGCCGIGR